MPKFLRMPRHWLPGIEDAALCQAAGPQTPQGQSITDTPSPIGWQNGCSLHFPLCNASGPGWSRPACAYQRRQSDGYAQAVTADAHRFGGPAGAVADHQTVPSLFAEAAPPAAGSYLIELRIPGVRWTPKVVIL